MIFLIVVADGDVVSELDPSAVGTQPLGYHAQEGGFSAAVVTVDEHVLAFFDKKREVLKERLVPVALAQIASEHDLVSALPALVKAHARGGGQVARTLYPLELCELLFAALCGDDVALSVPPTLLRDVRLYARYLLLLIFVMTALYLAVGAFFLGVCGVAARVIVSLAVLYLEYSGAYTVEKISVVRDGDDRLFPRGQIFLEPEHRGGVEVVGRFVEQHDIRFLEQQPDECESGLLSSAER